MSRTWTPTLKHERTLLMKRVRRALRGDTTRADLLALTGMDPTTMHKHLDGTHLPTKPMADLYETALVLLKEQAANGKALEPRSRPRPAPGVQLGLRAEAEVDTVARFPGAGTVLHNSGPDGSHRVEVRMARGVDVAVTWIDTAEGDDPGAA